MKKVLIGLVVLVVAVVALVGGAVWYGFTQIDSIAKSLIEKGATYVLDVPTTLDTADVQIAKSAFEMKGLNVANPSGYTTSHFLALNSGGVSLDAKSIKTKLIELPTLTLTGIDVNLEKAGGKANYQQILDNVKRFEDKDASKPSSGSGSEYTFVIRRVEIRDINAHAQLLPIGGDATKVDVNVPEIVLTDVGSGGKPVSMSELINIITKAVMSSIISVGGNVLPTEMLGDLKGSLGSLSSLGDVGAQVFDKSGAMIGDLQGTIGGLTSGLNDAAKGLQDGADKLKKDADKIGEGISDLLGGKKDK